MDLRLRGQLPEGEQGAEHSSGRQQEQNRSKPAEG
jgi:hypothetical protein